MKPLLLLLLGCTTEPPPLLVLTPGSAQVPVERLVRDWATSERTQATVVFDDSAALARMVDGGTPADLLLLSDTVRMDGLEDRQHLDPDTRAALAGDDLAVLGSVVATRPARDLPALAQGEGPLLLPPEDSAETVAARALLEDAGHWGALSPRVVYAHDEQALLDALVEDPAASGILSAGRANLGANVSVAFTLSPAEPPLLLEGAVVAHADRPDVAARLLDFLQSPEAEAPFRARGFRGVREGMQPVGGPHHGPPPGGQPGGPSGQHAGPGGPGGPGGHPTPPPPPHGEPAGPPTPVQPPPGPPPPGAAPDGVSPAHGGPGAPGSSGAPHPPADRDPAQDAEK